ncbi:MAG: hypothetical protein JWO13_197 [Acidobacteriales bacterium]|nr:hypothetical protein [Terriglobales bacterium]
MGVVFDTVKIVMAFNPIKTFFKSLGVALVCAGIAFFSANFVGIISLMIYQAFSHRTPDYSVAYKFAGAPLGALAFFVGFTVIFVRDLRKVGQ